MTTTRYGQVRCSGSGVTGNVVDVDRAMCPRCYRAQAPAGSVRTGDYGQNTVTVGEHTREETLAERYAREATR